MEKIHRSSELNIASGQSARYEKYWLAQLAGEISKSTFPYDSLEAKTGQAQMESVKCEFSQEIGTRLIQLSNHSDSRLHMVLAAALNVLLERYTAISDIILGTPIYKQKEEGEFINTVLALRNRTRNGITFKELILQVRQTILEAVENQNYPLEIALEQLNITSGENDFPLFGVAILIENIQHEKYIDHLPLETVFSFLRKDTGIELTLKYNTFLYRKETIERIIAMFRRLLEKIIFDVDVPVLEVEILSENEQKRILYEFNRTTREYPHDKTIVELFTAQAEHNPHQVAVVYNHQHLTYGALQDFSSRLAGVLRQGGSSGDNITALLLERSIEMIIAIFAILKSGGAYLPLDPQSPPARNRLILKDSRTGIIITQKQWMQRNSDVLKDFPSERIIVFDHRKKYPHQFPTIVNHIDMSHKPGNLDYVLYTSGTTGIPKGVMMEHHSVNNLVYGLNDRVYKRYGKGLKVALVAPYIFDASVKQIFGGLLLGHCLYVVPGETRLNGESLLDFYRKERIDVSDGTPAHLTLILETPVKNRQGLTLKHLLIGGERLPLELVEAFYRGFAAGTPVITNVYGPAECCVDTTSFEISQENIKELTYIPIGTSMPNKQVYILDEKNRVQPIGLVGELYIGGVGVARGYLNRPELTRDQFKISTGPGIHNSYMSYRSHKSYIYKTGDLGRWHDDGNIEFLGRRDSQVKIRGFRIELEEIRSQLQAHKEVKDVVVTTKELAPAKGSAAGKNNRDEYICAYIVTEREVNLTRLKEYLSGKLPGYMIPAYFKQVERIPLTPNGKTDLRALPHPRPGAEKADYIAPAGREEKKLQGIWHEVLGVPLSSIGTRDDFFDLGGHSLKAVILINRIRSEFNVEFPLREVFARPTIQSSARYIAAAGKKSHEKIQPVEKREYYRCSSVQTRLYILQQMEKNFTAYNIPVVLELEGKLHRQKLEQTFRQLITRHESLRTSFAAIQDKTVQIVRDEVEFKIEYYDTGGGSVIKNFIRSFDLTRAPLLRVGLIKEEARHILMINMHHIISDGASTGILAKDFMALYAGQELSPLRIRYRDYSHWQSRRNESKKMQRWADFWQEELKEDLPVLNLPTDYERTPVQAFDGGIVSFEIPQKETAMLKTLAAEEQATLYMVLLSLYYIVLARVSGQDDIIVGSVVEGRNHDDLSQVIGMFVNTLPMRNYPQGGKTYRQFLQEVRECAINSFENRDYPFKELVENVTTHRDISRNPLFDVAFFFNNQETSGLKIPGLKLTRYEYEKKTSRFDLTLATGERGEALSMKIEYRTGLFKETTIKRLGQFLKKIIESVIARPGGKIGEIEIISDAEKKRVLYDFNDTRGEYPWEETIHGLFERQEETTPDRTALVGAGQLTYRELNEKSERLACLLKEKGVGLETIVAIMVERTLEMIIGILGILKAGAAYLPIDANYPRERIKFMLNDSGVQVLVVDDNTSASWLSFAPGALLNLSEGRHLNFPVTRVSGCPVSLPAGPAYVIYTSGSTGRPKGIVIRHGNVVNFIEGITTRITFETGKSILCLTTISFDIFVLETLLPLTKGLKVIIADEQEQLDTGLLTGLVKKNQIEMVQVTPSHLKLLLEDIDCLRGVSVLLVGGEAFPGSLYSRLTGRFSGRVYNLYGPTETTVWSTIKNLSGSRGGAITIGRPISNTYIYILAGNRQLQPIGIPGELCIGGDGLARGYLNQPELTAEKFDHDLWDYQDYHDEEQKAPGKNDRQSCNHASMLSPHHPNTPIPHSPHSSIYRTGDLARWLPEGDIDFLGRMDHQVKIRGFRIELGEIRSQLLKHEEVKDVVVTTKGLAAANGSTPGKNNREEYICAYIVSDREVNISQMKEYLSGKLPGYMIPAYFKQVEKIPLTPNGKTDLKALTAPQPGAEKANYIAPRNAVEEKLAALWSKVLAIEKNVIGIDSNFFQLGGHSLKATILAAKIHKAFDAKITIKEIFIRPTIRGLAHHLKSVVKNPYASLKPAEMKEYYALSSSQKRIYILQQMELSNVSYNMSQIIPLAEAIEPAKLENAFKKLIERHESLRTSFEMIDEALVQKIHREVDFAIQYDEVRKNEVEDISKRFTRPFDLSRAPLLRVGLFKTLEDGCLLGVDMHHIISDGVSHAILRQDFKALYSGRTLPPIHIQYKDYSAWKNSKTYRKIIKAQEVFWMEEFKGETPVLDLPMDYPRPTILSYKGGIFSFEINREVTTALNRLALQEKATLFMVLLAAWNVLLAKICGQEDIILGTPIAGRGCVDLERTIGMFVNTLVLKSHVNADVPFNKYLRQVKQRTLEFFLNQDYPFDELVEKLSIDRNPGRNPLFDIMFALQNMVIETEDAPHQEPAAARIARNMKSNQPGELQLPLDLIISASEIGETILVSMKYCTELFKENTIRRISGYFMKIAATTAQQQGIPISEIDILPEEEKQRVIYNFNNTRRVYPGKQTIHELFEEQVLKTPEHIAARAAVDFRDVYEELNSGKANPDMFARLETCCFNRNKYLFECRFKAFDESNPFILLKTPQHNIAVVNENVFKLLDLFDGIKNLTSIYNLLRASGPPLAFLVYAVNIDDVLEISFSFKKKEIFLLDGNFTEFIRLVKLLYSINFIQLVNVNLETVDKNEFKSDIPIHQYFEPVKPGIVNPAEAVQDKHLLDNLAGYRKNLPLAEVLLLGDTPGQSSAGLLYLASYLKRNGINALCLFNDALWESASLQKNIEELLMKVKPRIVGISMKWFIHIARVLGLGKIVKEYSQRNGLDIKVVLGGNSASFFWEDVIKDENVDYIIRGDGELPLLKLCRGETPVPNLVYKKDGEIIANPITYIQTPGNSADIYLSHMDEIMISHYSCVFGIFFIFTQKGCQKNCHYCGGCSNAQRIAFNRGGLFRRNVSEVRKDIIESKKFTSTIFFLFDEYSNDTLLEYCKEIWEGIDLTRHIGFLSNVILPTPELIEYCNKVFQYVYWNLDIASMSERHRLQLLSKNMVKAQPTDKELLEIFDECEKYDNNEIIINFITGLPYFNQEDIEASKRMLSHIINKYSCFGEYFWARLHAEPGAPVIAQADKYDMYSLATNYEEFYEYSRKGFQEFELYPNVDNFTYPYIYFKDEELNSAVSKYYAETHQQWLQYKKSKQRKAIVTDDLTYRRLNERADRLVEILKDKGVRPDTIVGVMVERSLDMIVGLLGILKAGGAYLPLDPEYPETRIAYMMEDCQAKLLLSHGRLPDRIPNKNNECEIIDLGAMEVISNSPPGSGAFKPAEVGERQNSLAYIIFTSGTTGRPKGAAIEHRSIVNTLVWRKNHYRFDENDIVLQLPSFSFDSSVEDIFTPLISGSQLLMVQAYQRFEMDYMRELLKTIHVTHFLNVPALYKIYLEEIPGALAGLKHITIAGENFTEDLVIRHFQRLPQVRMYNEYGPTENSVCSTVYQFSRDRTGISIGKPISNIRCYILDSSGGLCPIGTAGELCLAGVGISRGYINNPGLTAEKFDRDKRNKVPGSNSIYKTGDLVRWLPDGNIEFLGRIDNQVKIRGYRVETGEIANRLLKHAAVDDAVVMVREYIGGEKYLAAYIVTAGRSAKLTSQLREYLAAVLPEYMVPSHFITIDRIPLTPGGKIDTRALPDPEAGLSASYAAPGNEIERKLVEIWVEILPGSGETGDRVIGIDDNFFQLGGHSLKATAMVSRIHRIFNVKVPMMEIFNWPTVRGLSRYIKKTVGDRFISIEPAEKKSYYVLSAAQRRLYYFQQMNKTSIAYNSPNAYLLEEETDKEKLELAFKKLIQRHDSFRTSFHVGQNSPGYAVQRVQHRVEFVAAYHEVETKEAIQEIIKHFARPFDLSRAPLLRVGLIKARGDQQVLVYDMHHIITDGASMEILIRDFMALYTGKELPGLRLQYKDYAQWQSSPARLEAIKKQEEFWLRIFAGKKPVLDLPTDHARPAVQGYEGSSFPFVLEPEQTRQLKALAVENEATLFMVGLGLFSVLLSRLSGQEDIVIGTGSQGRRHEDLRRIIGMFVNTLALRTYPGKNKTFSGFLKELKESTLAAFENQDYPFENLVEKVVPQRDATRNPLFDVMFQFQAAGDSQNQARTLKVKPYEMKVGISKFDLTLWGFEIGESLFFNFEYCTRLFEEETIIKMTEYFKRIIAALLENPGEQLKNIKMFTEEEQEAELVQFTDDLELELDEME